MKKAKLEKLRRKALKEMIYKDGLVRGEAVTAYLEALERKVWGWK